MQLKNIATGAIISIKEFIFFNTSPQFLMTSRITSMTPTLSQFYYYSSPMKKPLLGLAGLSCLFISISQVWAASSPKPLPLAGNFNGITTSYYGTDTNVFYHTCEGDRPDCFILVPEADPKTFTMVVDKNSSTPGIAHFAKDAKHVYFGYSMLPLANPKTFTLLDSPFARDARRVYYGSTLLRGVNARTFKKLNVFYATDGRNVVYMNKILRGANARAFRVLTDEKGKARVDWGYDGKNVYYEDVVMKGLNPKTLTVFSSYLFKDDRAMYCMSQVLKGVDVATFVMLNEFYAKDKNHGYVVVPAWTQPSKPCQLFIIEDADPATLKGFVRGDQEYHYLAIDAKHIFSEGVAIPNADLKNFDPDAWYEKLLESYSNGTREN